MMSIKFTSVAGHMVLPCIYLALISKWGWTFTLLYFHTNSITDFQLSCLRGLLTQMIFHHEEKLASLCRYLRFGNNAKNTTNNPAVIRFSADWLLRHRRLTGTSRPVACQLGKIRNLNISLWCVICWRSKNLITKMIIFLKTPAKWMGGTGSQDVANVRTRH